MPDDEETSASTSAQAQAQTPVQQFQANQKLFSITKTAIFQPTTSDVTITAREFQRYFKNFVNVLEILGITDPDHRQRIWVLHDVKLIANAKALVGDDETSVAAQGDVFKKLQKKVEIYLQCTKLEEPARQKLSTLRQRDTQLAADLLIEIRELHDESGYSDGDKEEFVRSTFIRAAKHDKVREYWRYSNMRGKTPLTIAQLVDVANAVAAGESSKEKTYTHSQVVNAVKHFSYRKPKSFQSKDYHKGQSSGRSYSQRPPKGKCLGCGASGTQHKYLSDNCPAVKAVCRCCRTGHFYSVCLQRKKSSKKQWGKNKNPIKLIKLRKTPNLLTQNKLS